MKKILFITIGIMIFSLSIVFVLSEKKDFSENENRYLASMPEFNLSNLKSGKYVLELEDFVTDSFPFRDFVVGVKTEIDKLIGKKDINEVYLGSDGFMLTKYNRINPERLILLLNDFKKSNQDKNISLMIVPSSISIYQDKLPKYAITDNEVEVIKEIYQNVSMNNIDIYNDLVNLKEKKQVFYKTDHHWTTYGSYEAYLKYCKQNNLVPNNMSNFRIENIDNFYGTLYSKTNNYNVSPDVLTLFKTNTNYIVNYVDINKQSNSLYDDSYLKVKDKYSVFLSNNHSLLTIDNNDILNDEEILVIKDSYGNSFVPFIAEHYKRVHVVDLRYNLNSMTDYLKKNTRIKNVLILYNINTINDESSIYYLR